MGRSGVIPSPSVTTCSGRGDGQQLVVAPEVGAAAGDRAWVGGDAAEVVPRQQRRPVGGHSPCSTVASYVAPHRGHSRWSSALKVTRPSNRPLLDGQHEGAQQVREPLLVGAARCWSSQASSAPSCWPCLSKARLPAGVSRTCTLRRSCGSTVRVIRPSSSSGVSRTDRAPRLRPSSSASRDGWASYGAPSRRSASSTLNDARVRSSSPKASSRALARCLVTCISRATISSWSESSHGSRRPSRHVVVDGVRAGCAASSVVVGSSFLHRKVLIETIVHVHDDRHRRTRPLRRRDPASPWAPLRRRPADPRRHCARRRRHRRPDPPRADRRRRRRPRRDGRPEPRPSPVRRARPGARRRRPTIPTRLGRRLGAPAPLVLPGDPQPGRHLPPGTGGRDPAGGRPPRRGGARPGDGPDDVRRGWASVCRGWITDNVLADRDAAPALFEPGLVAGAREGDDVLLFEAQRHLGDHAHDDGDLETRGSGGASRPPPAPGPGTSADACPRRCCSPCCCATRATRPAHGRSRRGRSVGGRAGVPSVVRQAEGFLAGVDPTRPPEDD